MLDGLTVALGATEQDAVLACRPLKGQLVEGQGLTASLHTNRQQKGERSSLHGKSGQRTMHACKCMKCLVKKGDGAAFKVLPWQAGTQH